MEHDLYKFLSDTSYTPKGKGITIINTFETLAGDFKDGTERPYQEGQIIKNNDEATHKAQRI